VAAFLLESQGINLSAAQSAGRRRAEQSFVSPDELPTDYRYREGAATRILVNQYERDPRARLACVAKYGTTCFVCDFDFAAVYGEIGAGYIHVHHLVPLSAIGTEYELDPIADLRPVCPNCHAMLHQRNPPFAPAELRATLARRTR